MNKEELRQAFFKDHTYTGAKGLPKIATAPHDLFEWFYDRLSLGDVGQSFYCGYYNTFKTNHCSYQCRNCKAEQASKEQ